MKKLAIATALMAFPIATFAGGAGNANLLQYTNTNKTIVNFDPSTRAQQTQAVIGAIGSETDLNASSKLQTDTEVTITTVPTTTRTRTFRPTTSSTSSVDTSATYNRREYSSSKELLDDREAAARKKLLRYRNLR